jgi:uncharacterized protein (DUF305 family)
MFTVAAASVGCQDDPASDSCEILAIPADDVDFIDQLAPHHASAIDMADEVIARGADAHVKTMAQQMKDAQNEEIAKMEVARQELTGRRMGDPVEDPHSEQDMAEMAKLSGIELDRAFLVHMIPHHADAVSVAHRALRNLERHDMRELAEMTVVAQTREMNEMLEMLDMLDMLEHLGE